MRAAYYGNGFDLLDDEVAYTPVMVVETLYEKNFFADDQTPWNVRRTRGRIAMARWVHNHGFPPNGDTTVMRFGQAPMVAWYGWRWKKSRGRLSDVFCMKGYDFPLGFLFQCLNPAWRYSAEALSQFAKDSGLASLLWQKKQMGSISRRLADMTKEAGVDAWFGWRWQGFDSLIDAQKWVHNSLQKIRKEMPPLTSYEKLIDGTQEGANKYCSKKVHYEPWPKLIGIFTMLSCVRLAREKGLSCDDDLSRIWRREKAVPTLPAGSLGVLHHLDPSKSYSIEDLVILSGASNPMTAEEIQSFRITAYRLAHAHNFPELGDSGNVIAPKWRGERWRQCVLLKNDGVDDE